MRTEDEIKADLVTAIETYNESLTKEDADVVVQLRQELIEAYTEGATPCEDCGNMPIGIKQPVAAGSVVLSYYEIGCVVCRDHKAKAQTREEAVDNWNNGIFVTK